MHKNEYAKLCIINIRLNEKFGKYFYKYLRIN